MLVDAALVSGPVAWVERRLGGHAPTLRRKVGRWLLIVRTDRFDARAVCSLTSHDVSIQRGAAVFRLGPQVRTFDAEYRIDDGPARSWRADAMTLAAHGVALQSDDLANPSEGRVPIPVEPLAHAQTVLIRPFVGGHVRRFKVAGVEAALAVGDKNGCGPQFRGTGATFASGSPQGR